MNYIVVTTYPTMGVQAKSQRRIFQKGKHVGVDTNVYSRKMLEKPKKKRSANIEKKGSGVVYAWGKVLAPHASVTRDGSL